MADQTPAAYWADDRYWTDALERYHRLRDEGQTHLTVDLTAIEEAAHRDDGPAFRLKDAMLSVQEHEADEGFRAPHG